MTNRGGGGLIYDTRGTDYVITDREGGGGG